MSEIKTYPIPTSISANTLMDESQYEQWYQESIEHPEKFWAARAKEFVHWSKPWTKVLDCDFPKGKISWFEGAELNVSYNCIDKHLSERGDQIAIIWEGDDPSQDK
ncbi:MAG: acetyl-coenzyme A synthetase, partial [Gammaproteobacteria bacterium]|nr:acetyl-coenzyme A synthetase [Gammaproteobacteria bacterium]